MARCLFVGLLCGLLSFSVPGVASPPGSLTLAWNPVPDPNIAGYNLYYGVVSRIYTDVVPVGNAEQVTITGLVPGVTYFLAVTSRLSSGLESAYSDEISFVLPTTAPSLEQAVSPSGQFYFAGSAPAGHTYDILATQDFALWLAIDTVTVDVSGRFEFADPDASLYPSRFYQLHETTYTTPGSLPVVNDVTATADGLSMAITGQVGHTYEILTSPDYQTWGVIGALTAGIGGTAVAAVPANPYFPFAYFQLRETDYASAQTIVPFTFYTVLPGFIQILFEVQPGPTYNLIESRDLSSWTSIQSLSFSGSGTSQYSDTFDPADLPRTYRLNVSN